MKTLIIWGLVILVGIWTVISFSGDTIDKTCIEGRLSEDQANVINQLEWGKCPGYRNGVCRAEEGDRVLVRECSELSKKVF